MGFSGPAGERAGAEPPGFQAARLRLEHLAAFVRAFVRPALDPEEEALPLGRGNLMVLARPDKLAWVTRFLAENRRQRRRPVTVQARFLKVPAALFSAQVEPLLRAAATGKVEVVGDVGEVPGDAEEVPGEVAEEVPPGVSPPANRYALLPDSKATEALLAALQKEPKVQVLGAPRITAALLSSSHLLLGEKIGYVRDFEIEVNAATVIANPIVDTVVDGIEFECTAAVIAPGILGMQFRFSVSRVERPMRTFTTTLAKHATPLMIQLPEVKRVALQSGVELRAEETALFAAKTVEGDYVVVLLGAQPGDGTRVEGR